MLSALLQMFIAVNIWWVGMVWYAGLTDKVSPEIWDLKIMWAGSVFMIGGWCMHPVGMTSIYFVVEGVGRLCAAAVADEALCSGPLKLLCIAVTRVTRPRVPNFADTVERSGNNYVVRCAQPKDWGGSVAISLQSGLYFVSNQRREGAAHIYTLRPVREGEVVRGVRDYSPIS